MDWWKKLRRNGLARWGASLLLIFYLTVIGADFIAPYNPYESQVDGSLLPPTRIYWRSPSGNFQGPTVYPTRQLPTDIETGQRPLDVDFSQPSPVRLWVKGDAYRLGQIGLPLPPSFEMVEIFPGINGDRHLFGTVGPAKINLLGTDEQGRDQF
ncbi:MAG: ABC transporter permease, partial [Synechocystis sp.]|nr:ABC transporter permease [Synechocystis sp.]